MFPAGISHGSNGAASPVYAGWWTGGKCSMLKWDSTERACDHPSPSFKQPTSLEQPWVWERLLTLNKDAGSGARWWPCRAVRLPILVRLWRTTCSPFCCFLNVDLMVELESLILASWRYLALSAPTAFFSALTWVSSFFVRNSSSDIPATIHRARVCLWSAPFCCTRTW